MWWAFSTWGYRDAPGWSFFPGVPGWGCVWPQRAYDLGSQSEFMVVLGILNFFVVSSYAISDSCSATYQSWQEAEPVTS